MLTVNCYNLAALSIALTIATNEWGWLDENPMKKVKKRREPKGRVRFLEKDEIIRLLDACQKVSNPYLYKVVVLALSTGARFSEVMNLKWQDIDLERRKIVFMNTKNGDNRALSLTPTTFELLKSHSKIRKINSAYIFPRQDGKAPVELRKYWYKAVKTLELRIFAFTIFVTRQRVI